VRKDTLNWLLLTNPQTEVIVVDYLVLVSGGGVDDGLGRVLPYIRSNENQCIVLHEAFQETISSAIPFNGS
jgi:hypothetical protein